MSKLFLLLVLLLCLSGCGQKGPLFLPDSDDTQETR
ncbi:MAG: lipoprotein [Xanthomonadaceae bacterium]|nr:lipoprotein [Xanthomonadaceae bacterium]